jgi:transposase
MINFENGRIRSMAASPYFTVDWMEWRRLRAWGLKQQGWAQCDIAEALGVTKETVSRWVNRAREGGSRALLSHPALGPRPRLTAEQKGMIPEFLWHGPEAYGFRGRVWSCARIAQVIEEEFHVRYHKDHVGRLLKELHWTPQVPIRRAIQRDEAAIQRWRAQRWPGLMRRARRERRALILADESGFYLLPGMVKTYAPEGRTPVLRAKLTRDHISVIGGMTPRGKVYTLIRQESLNGLHCIEFLKHLLSVTGRRLLVVWDGSPIHRRVAVKEFVGETGGRVLLEYLPGYAPDLNPWDEGGWHHLKNVELGNVVCRDLEELDHEFHLAVERLRQKPHLIRSFFEQAELSV